VEFAIGADAIALAAAIGEFFDRRDDARAIAEASATGSAMSRSRWVQLCGIGLPALRAPEPDGIGACLLDSTAVAERLGAVLLPEPASSSIVMACALGSGISESVLDGSRVISLASGGTARFDPDGTLTGRIRIADDDITNMVAVPIDGPCCGVALLDRSALGAGPGRCDVDPSRPTTFCDVRGAVPVEVVPKTPEDLATLIREWAVLTAAELVGGMQSVLTSTIEFAKDRKQFGRSIGSFQAIKHQLADMYIAVEQSRAAVQFAAISCDASAATTATDVAAAARWVPASAIELFEGAIHVHGAMGYSWEVGVHLHLRRAVATRTLLRESGVTEPQTVVGDTRVAS
jgi:hypothetical protein